MNRNRQICGIPGPPSGFLKLYTRPSVEVDGGTFDVDVREPGLYRLQIWSDQEWSALRTEDRPDEAFGNGSHWFAFDPVPN